MPNATKYHGLCLSPVKKVSVLAFLEVMKDIAMRIAKYATRTIMIRLELIN
jgi:hypothetical protein